MTGWFEKERATESARPLGAPAKSDRLPGHSVAENAAAAKEALDKIQGDYNAAADQLQDEFSRHADQIQGIAPEWSE